MAVFSKFAVSAVVVAVGYEGERCETASALQMQTLAEFFRSEAPQGREAPKGNGFLQENPSPDSQSQLLTNHILVGKPKVGYKNDIKITTPARILKEDVSVENGNITLDMITKVKEQLSNTEKVDEVLHKIGCSDPEKKTMQNLLHYLTDAPIEEKEMFCKTFTDLQAQGSTRPWVHAAIKFMHTFGELVKGEGSKCGLKGAIQGLLDETPDLQTPDREEEAIVIELLKKNPGLKKKAEQAVKEIKSSSKGGLLEKILLGIGIVSIAAVVILLVVCVFCVCGSSAGSTAMSCM